MDDGDGDCGRVFVLADRLYGCVPWLQPYPSAVGLGAGVCGGVGVLSPSRPYQAASRLCGRCLYRRYRSRAGCIGAGAADLSVAGRLICEPSPTSASSLRWRQAFPCDAGAQVVESEWSGEQVALEMVAAAGDQALQLLLGFNAFCQHGHAVVLADGNDVLHHGQGVLSSVT